MKLMPISKTVSAEPVEARPTALRYPFGRRSPSVAFGSTGSGLAVFFRPLVIT